MPNDDTPPTRGSVRIYDRPPAWRRMLPRVLVSVVLMVLSSLASWWVYARLF